MSLSLLELHSKDVVHIKTGEILGRIDDLVFDETSGNLQSAVLRGRLHLFGLLGRDDDLVIPWEHLKSIGTDVIMVDTEVPAAMPKRRRIWFL